MSATMGAFIDSVLQHWLEINPSDTYVATQWRPRVLHYAQLGLGLLWPHLTDSDKYRSATVVFVDGVGDVPLGFSVAGPGGGLFFAASEKRGKLRYSDPTRLLEELHTVGSTSGYPTFYSIINGELLLDVLVSGSYKLYYKTSRPELIDTNVDPDNSGLQLLPVDFHDVLFINTIDWLALQAGDGRAGSELSPRAEKHLAAVISGRDHGQEDTNQLGDFGISELGME
jgi:hypothetical protein